MLVRRSAAGVKEATMSYDLWAVSSGNRISETDDETEMRRLVGELLTIGWSADELSLGLPDNVTVLDGSALAAWVEG